MKNFIEEIIDLLSDNKNSSKHQIIEQKSINIIISSVNLMNELKKNFTNEEFDILQKKFFLSIKNNDPDKFIKKYKYLLYKKSKSEKNEKNSLNEENKDIRNIQ